MGRIGKMGQVTICYSPRMSQNGNIVHRFHGHGLLESGAEVNLVFEQDEKDMQVFRTKKKYFAADGQFRRIAIRLVDHLFPVSGEPIQAVLEEEGTQNA